MIFREKNVSKKVCKW